MMKRCELGLTRKALTDYQGELLVFLVGAQQKKTPLCDEVIKPLVKELFKLGDFSGKADETITLYPGKSADLNEFSCKRIMLVGVGALKKSDDTNTFRENLRKTGGNISAAAKKLKVGELLLAMPGFIDKQRDILGACLAEGMLLGNYRFEKYKKPSDKSSYQGLQSIKIGVQGNRLRGSIKSAATGAHAAMSARDMANEPANHWTPEEFSEFGKNLAKDSALKCSIFGKAQLKKMGMGGILAVNQGSSLEPKMVVLEHRPPKFGRTILLVGKGITFDSGGVSLKPAAGMEDMKYDMCGGAAVIAAMQGVAEEQPKTRVIAIVPTTDNMSGSSAIKPGDVITHYNGTTSEIINTDAEGRLILADALAYGIKKYKPDCVVDLATLTGAVIIGLGHHRTGMMSNNDVLADALYQIGEETGEKVWRLPLDPEYSEQIDSEVADIKNIGGRGGGSITAAAYLQKFVGDTPWAHLDIAGTAWEYTKKSYVPKGPSGIGVRLLLGFIKNSSKLKF
jgi:leucyl aminopeptidase